MNQTYTHQERPHQANVSKNQGGKNNGNEKWFSPVKYSQVAPIPDIERSVTITSCLLTFCTSRCKITQRHCSMISELNEVFLTWLSNYTPQGTVGCNYLAMPEISHSGDLRINCVAVWKYSPDEFISDIRPRRGTICYDSTLSQNICFMVILGGYGH